MTVNIRCHHVIVPVRGETSRFRSTEYATVPLPVPGLPLVTATQDALLVAVHRQWAAALTAKAPVTLSLLYEALDGEISMAQATSAVLAHCYRLARDSQGTGATRFIRIRRQARC